MVLFLITCRVYVGFCECFVSKNAVKKMKKYRRGLSKKYDIILWRLRRGLDDF